MAKIYFPINTEIRYIPEEKPSLVLVSAVNRLTALQNNTPTEATNNEIIVNHVRYPEEVNSNNSMSSLERELQKIITILKEAILYTKEENSTIFNKSESKEYQCLEQIGLISQKMTKHFKSLSLQQIIILEQKLKDRINYLTLSYHKKLKSAGLMKILTTTGELLTLKKGESKNQVKFMEKLTKDKKSSEKSR